MTSTKFKLLLKIMAFSATVTIGFTTQVSLAGTSFSKAKDDKLTLSKSFEIELEKILLSLELRKPHKSETIAWDQLEIPVSFYARIGLSYLVGKNGVYRDDFKALLYLKMAKEEKDPWADFGLALSRKRGITLPRNPEETGVLLIIAAAEGLAPARYALALASLHGYGVDRDYKTAAEILDELAEQGSSSAKSLIGKMKAAGLR